MMRAAVVHSVGYECDIGPHVFPMQKFRLVRERLLESGAIGAEELLEPSPATPEELRRVHSDDYLQDLAECRWTERTRWSELPLTPDIVRAYTLACGGTVLAAREALDRGAGINLGGGFHHAYGARAEGFCYLNDLAVAAAALLADGRVRRVAIVDLDVHQGNGTAHIFADHASVFTLSVHHEQNYPVPKERSRLDVGLPTGTGDDAYLGALNGALEAMWGFQPEAVLYQAGADPYRDDLLGGLQLTLEGLASRDRQVLEGCAARAIPCAITLGGGYARRLEDTVCIHEQTCLAALGVRRAVEGRAP